MQSELDDVPFCCLIAIVRGRAWHDYEGHASDLMARVICA